ncbi:MAG: carbonic anhydrase [Proteobacteria bacterium]|nr:carbonic anhydrase [Pseudomonadota bacterium]
MIVSCCDSRVEPALILDAAPGDLFVVRNVANLVPPYGPDAGYHGTSAALEFAVKGLAVEHIVIMGHSQCGGIHSLLHGDVAALPGDEFIGQWVSITDATRERVLAEHPDASEAEKQKTLEQLSIGTSLANLRSFPFIAEREAAGTLALHGWYFDIDNGDLLARRGERGTFEKIEP